MSDIGGDGPPPPASPQRGAGDTAATAKPRGDLPATGGRKPPSRLARAVATGPTRISRAQYVDFLPDTEALAERRHSPFARLLLIVVTVFVLGLVAYMAIAKVETVAVASGVVRPSGDVKVINHPEGGRVREIFVRDGDPVIVGEPLVSLDPTMLDEEVAKLVDSFQTLSARHVRLQAEAAGADSVVFPEELTAARPALVASERDQFVSRFAELEGRRAAANQVVRQREKQIEGLKSRISSLASSVAVLRDQIAKLATLVEKEYFPELRFLSAKRSLVEEEGELDGARKELEQAEAALQEARDSRELVDRQWRSELLAELADVTAERDQFARSLSQEQDRQQNLVLRAPAAGIVQNLAVHTVGQSIPPTEPIMNIVPTDDQLIIEARVSNQDIGQIVLEQRATVKFQTYDWIKYGTLEGKVVRISPDANFDKENGIYYFSVFVRTPKAFLGDDPERNHVNPGMVADVDLRTGDRTILSYVTDRVTRTAGTAFRE